MTQTYDEKQDPGEMLPDGILPLLGGEPPNPQETIALHLSTGIYVQQIIQEAEYSAQLGNSDDVAATLSQGSAHLDVTSDLEGMGPRDPDEETKPERDRQEDSSIFTPAQAAATLIKAKNRLNEAVQRHSNHIIRSQSGDQSGDQYDDLETLASATSGIIALSAALTFHIQQMTAAGQEHRPAAEGHNLASQAMADNIWALQDHILRHYRQGPGVVDPTIHPSLTKRADRAAATALRQYDDAESLRNEFTPLEFHESLDNDEELREIARERARELTGTEQNFMLQVSMKGFEIQNCLVLIHYGSSIYVKRATDEYPDGTTRDAAITHAQAMRDFADIMDKKHGYHTGAGDLRHAADHLNNLAFAGLHTVNPQAFRDTLAALAPLCDNPHTLRNAADQIFADAPELREYYLQQTPDIVQTMGTPEQVAAVVQSAVDAGMASGAIRSLCNFLLTDPAVHGVPQQRDITWEEMSFLLDKAEPFLPDPFEAEDLMIAVGYDPESEQAAEWLRLNAPEYRDDYGNYEDDDDDDLDDDDDD